MNISQYLKRRDVRTMVDPSCIETYCDKNNKTITCDTRSYQKDGMWYVHPIGVSAEGSSIDILCPYCGKIHRHGNAPGHRASHCATHDNPGYVLVIGGER